MGSAPNIVDQKTAIAMRRLRTGLWTQAWKRLELVAAGRPIAVYGAGQHTKKLLRFVRGLDAGPAVRCIMDDHSELESLVGVPVVRPTDVSPNDVAAVLVSSDSIETELAERAHKWAGGGVPVETLYGSGFDSTMLFVADAAGDIVEIGTDGERLHYDMDGVQTVQQQTANPHRPTAAIEPVTEHRIWTLSTPGYTVSTLQVSREVGATFKPHQIYPGDRHRPNVDLRDESFVTKPEPGLVTPTTKVSVVGSCFAANFRLWLLKNGYNFCQFEDGPFAAFGSLRTGPLFNPGSVCQLAEWAYNGFDAADIAWDVGGHLCDPYRKFLSWPTAEDMHKEREAHFAATRSMIEQSEVLILTLGLSEVWRNREDKRCYYLIPPPGILDEQYHEHALLTVDECVDHLERFYSIARAANPSLRLVTTLSPVPMMATHFDRHAVVSDAISKATLRTALHWFCERHPEIVYFPSYEMAVRTPDWPYAADNRHVMPGPIVDRIMRAFVEAYGSPEAVAELVE
ncbi:MAG: GSCFA domain-containing protein, partial [Planctomycetota bacterium]